LEIIVGLLWCHKEHVDGVLASQLGGCCGGLAHVENGRRTLA